MTEKEIVLSSWPDDGLHGRRKIYCDAREITERNVVQVVSEAYATHRKNKAEIQYLYDYYRGKQDIRLRKKEIRPEILNKVVVNRANEIIAFKVSYLLGEPLQYVSRGVDDRASENINRLNEYMYSEGKAAKDKEVADWVHICGVGVRMVKPLEREAEEDESPVLVYTLDPREAFVIYYSGLGQRPVAGVVCCRDEDGEQMFAVYTRDGYFEIKNDQIAVSADSEIPYVPVIEYVNNEARMGAFEVVLPLLNEINTLESNRVDDIEQYVQSILVFENCEIDKEKANALKEKLGLMIQSEPGNSARVYRVDGELSQSGVQTAVDDAYEAVLTICGMPNRNGGSSTSDTGAATIMRDGWSAAESRAKDTETLWRRSEREFLRIVLDICRETGAFDLRLSQIDMKFTRRNYADLQSKAQVLMGMLNNDKIHPKLAYQSSGMFTDAEDAYRISMQYAEEQRSEMEKSLRDELNVRADRQGDRTAEQAGGPAV